MTHRALNNLEFVLIQINYRRLFWADKYGFLSLAVVGGRMELLHMLRLAEKTFGFLSEISHKGVMNFV